MTSTEFNAEREKARRESNKWFFSRCIALTLGGVFVITWAVNLFGDIYGLEVAEAVLDRCTEMANNGVWITGAYVAGACGAGFARNWKNGK